MSRERVPDRSGLVSLGFGRVYVRDLGPEGDDLPPLILLHDFALSSHSWSMIQPQLAAERRVIALDLPGAGNSDRPAPASADGYSPGWLAKQCAAVISELGLTQVDVLAHGFGAAVAVLMPVELVRRAVLVTPLCFSVEPPFGARLRIPVVGPLLFRGLLRKAEFRAYLERHYSTPELLPKARFDVYWDRIGRDGGMEAAYAMEERMADVGDLADAYRAFGHPTLVVWGDRDHVAPVDDAERAAALLGDARLEVIDGCGHSPQEERPAALVRLVRDHCAG